MKIKTPTLETSTVQHHQPKPSVLRLRKKGKKVLVILAAGKGGIGKSLFATILANKLATNHSVRIIDSDIANKTTSQTWENSFPGKTDVVTCDLANTQDVALLFEGIKNSKKEIILWDLPGASKHLFFETVSLDLIGKMESQGTRVVMVAMQTVDGETLVDAYDYFNFYGQTVDWLFVKNYRDSPNDHIGIEKGDGDDLLAAAEPSLISIPNLPSIWAGQIANYKIHPAAIGDFAEPHNYGLLSSDLAQISVAGWLRQVHQQLDTIHQLFVPNNQ